MAKVFPKNLFYLVQLAAISIKRIGNKDMWGIEKIEFCLFNFQILKTKYFVAFFSSLCFVCYSLGSNKLKLSLSVQLELGTS